LNNAVGLFDYHVTLDVHVGIHTGTAPPPRLTHITPSRRETSNIKQWRMPTSSEWSRLIAINIVLVILIASRSLMV